MRFFDFILLKRNDWAHDKRAIEENLDRVNAKDPLWLVVFPEGTVVSRGTRKRSTAFAVKAGLVRPLFFFFLLVFFYMPTRYCCREEYTDFNISFYLLIG